jgi:hypothetical protein
MQLGNFGVWQPSHVTTMAMAREIEEIGFPTLWISGELPDLEHAAELLAGTDKLIIGTSIVNIWQGDPTTVATNARLCPAHTASTRPSRLPHSA